jgi:glycosyltransferase involved in cell wall biosynthesis
MNILWFKWKDIYHHKAGGAEFVDDYLINKLVDDGHLVTLITSKSSKSFNQKNKKKNKRLQTIRIGNYISVYFFAYFAYKKIKNQKFDLVIDEMNTFHFCTNFFIKEKKIILCYQLAKSVWFYQTFFPLNYFGFFFEKIYLKIISNLNILTESLSTKKDLIKHNISPNNISIFNIGINLINNSNLKKNYDFNKLKILSFGSIRPMKRTLDQIKSFEFVCQVIPKAQFLLAGDASSNYGKRVLDYISRSKFKKNIQYFNFVSNDEKIKLFKQANFILMTSIKEGWGLVITEANNFKVPAIGYNVDGIRDSIVQNHTGQLSKDENPNSLAQEVLKVWSNKNLYLDLSENAYKNSLKYSIDKSYGNFLSILKQNK